MEYQIMYQVEKFLPPHCPNCDQIFLKEGGHYIRVLKETSGYTLMSCCSCNNMTMKMQLETRTLFDKTAAERLIKEEGFVNLTEIQACGHMAQETIAKHMKKPDTEVYDVMKCKKYEKAKIRTEEIEND